MAKKKVCNANASLMELPREIRDMILKEMLVSGTFVKPYDISNPVFPNILQACGQLRAEGRHLLYMKNNFVLDEPTWTIHFFSEEFRPSRSMIHQITVYLHSGITELRRADHPKRSHFPFRRQATYQDLRTLAASMHQWSIAFSIVPAGLQSITVFPYRFVEYCNHVQNSWPLNATWFCPGCGLQQFWKDNKLEDFLPRSSLRQNYWEQGPQMVIPYQPDWNRKLCGIALQARQGRLLAVAQKLRKIIANG